MNSQASHEFLEHVVLDGKTSLSSSKHIDEFRGLAEASVGDIPLPSQKNEDWRFTDLSPLYKIKFQPNREIGLSQEIHKKFEIQEAKYRLVFVNGVYSNDHSCYPNSNSDFFIGTLDQAINCLGTDFAKKIGKIVDKNGELFVCLNNCRFKDCAVVMVGDGFTVTDPIHVLNISTGDKVFSAPRLYIEVNRGGRANVVEDYVSFESDTNLTNFVTEIKLDENAALTHCRLQREEVSSFNIGNSGVALEKQAEYQACFVSVGSKIARQNVEINQLGENVSCKFDGLAVLEGNQLVDLHSKVIHGVSNGKSSQTYKTILGGRSRAVFNGQIYVSSQGHLTDASQSNKNLLLSNVCHVDTKPQLEIFADDVKCSHGATIGQLNDDEIFYLRARGVDEEVARKLLIYGFAAEIIESIGINSLVQTLSDKILLQTGNEKLI